MKAVAIVINGSRVSEEGFNTLVKSSNKVVNSFIIERFDAITPLTVDDYMSANRLRWEYPWVGSVVDFTTGLTKTAYKTANPKARMACACSHYELWKQSAEQNINLLILEHDSQFIEAIDFDVNNVKLDIIGINNPLRATRKASMYYQKIIDTFVPYQLTPWIDDIKVPQGLAGNSAYIIKPSGAIKLLDLVHQYGLWPNDAIMCRQLIPRLGVTRKFYTTVQGLESTTSL